MINVKNMNFYDNMVDIFEFFHYNKLYQGMIKNQIALYDDFKE